MQQSSVIFANLLIAYLFFITARGELPTYITLLRGGGAQAGATPGANGAGVAPGSNSIVTGAEQLLGAGQAATNPASLTNTQANQIISLFGE